MGNGPTPAQILANKAAGLPTTPDGQPVVSTGTVFMGPGYGTRPKDTYYGSTTTAATAASNQMYNTVWSMEKAKAHYGMMDPIYRAQAEAYAAWRGGGRPQPDWTVQSQYEDALVQAQTLSKTMGEVITPWDYMKMRMSQSPPAYGAAGSGGGGGGAGAYSGPSTTTQVSLASQSDAEVLVDQALAQYLGRQADDGERDRFWKLLNRGQSNNPSVTTSTPNGHDATVVSRTGLNEQEAAKEFALSQKDSAEYMANTQYMDWLMTKVSTDPTEAIASGL